MSQYFDQLMSSPSLITNEFDIRYSTETLEKILNTTMDNAKKVRPSCRLYWASLNRAFPRQAYNAISDCSKKDRT